MRKLDFIIFEIFGAERKMLEQIQKLGFVAQSSWKVTQLPNPTLVHGLLLALSLFLPSLVDGCAECKYTAPLRRLTRPRRTR